MTKGRQSCDIVRPRTYLRTILGTLSAQWPFVLSLVMLGLPVVLSARPQNKASANTLPLAQAQFERGKEYLQARRFNQAVAEFAKLLKAFPDSPALYNLIGYCDLQQGLQKEAVTNFKKAVKLKPDYEAAHNNLGGIYFLEDHFLEAEDEFRTVIRIDPKNAQAYYNLARAEFASSQWSNGLEHLQAAFALAPGNMPIALALAAYDIEHGRKDQARPILQKLATIVPPDANLQLEVGELLLRGGMQHAALKLLENGMRQHPRRLDGSLFALARESFQKQNYKLTLRILEILGPSMQNSAKWHQLAGKTYLRVGKPANAATEFQKVIELEPGNVDDILQLGEIFVANNNSTAAAALFSAAVKFLPKSPRIWFGLGVAYLGETHYEDAVKALETSLALDPKLELAYVVLGQGYSEVGRWDLLQRTAQRLIALNPQSSIGYYYEALALLRNNSSGATHQEVEKLLQRSMALDEKDPLPRFQLAKLLLAEGKKGAAVQELQKIARAAPDFGPAHYQLFRLYRAAGQVEQSNLELKAFQEISAKETAESMRKMLVQVRQRQNSSP